MSDIRRWLERFDEVALVDRRALQEQQRPAEDSIRLALSLIRFARDNAIYSAALERQRAKEDESVRITWNRLRASLAK